MSTGSERSSSFTNPPRAARTALAESYGTGRRDEPISGPVSLAYARRVGRYLLLQELARGGMATVHLGRALGDHGFYRRVAIKRLLPQFTRDPQFTTMMLDEARIASAVTHPNVAGVIDVVQQDDELFLVLDYIHGDTLARLLRRAPDLPIPLNISASIVSGMLHGLHAAHVARDEYDEPLQLVHRDISPQNVMVGVDGLARVLDFGIAKALNSAAQTSKGDIKGKLAYMAPEQLRLAPATQKSDIYAAGVVLWEVLVGRRLFEFSSEREAFARPRDFIPERPSKLVDGLPEAIDEVVLRALAPEPEDRFESAREMALALEKAAPIALPSQVGDWVSDLMQRPPRRISRPVPAPMPKPEPLPLDIDVAEPEAREEEPAPTRIARSASGRTKVPESITSTRSTPSPALRLALIVLMSVAVAGLGYTITQGLLSHWAREAVQLVIQVSKSK